MARCWVLRDHTFVGAVGAVGAGGAGGCVGSCGGSALVVDRFPVGVVPCLVWGGCRGGGGCLVVGWCRAYVENCIVDASIFEFLWSSC